MITSFCRNSSLLMKDVFYNQEVVRVSEQNLKKFKESEQNLYVILALFISCHETPHSLIWFHLFVQIYNSVSQVIILISLWFWFMHIYIYAFIHICICMCLWDYVIHYDLHQILFFLIKDRRNKICANITVLIATNRHIPLYTW